MTKQEYLDMFEDDYKRKKSRRWWVIYPYAVYANNIDFDSRVTIHAAIDFVLNWLGTDELERGTEIYC